MTDHVSAVQVRDFCGLMEERFGLRISPERQPGLENTIEKIRVQLGFPSIEGLIRGISFFPPRQGDIEVLVSHFTVGETYFFRDKAVFSALEEIVLPELIRKKRETGLRLKLWSAGCSTGEEPYSLAILLTKLIPDIKKWDISILGTDINPSTLAKAHGGLYKEWSFRGTPPGIKDEFFKEAAGPVFKISPNVRGLVRFEVLNLAGNAYPSPVTNTCDMDIILCRNVLIYFTPETITRVISNFIKCLNPEGWFITGPVETSLMAGSGLERVPVTDGVLYKKVPAVSRTITEIGEKPGAAVPLAPKTKNRKPVIIPPPEPAAEKEPEIRATSADLAETCANFGRYTDALEWCGRALRENKADKKLYLFLAYILEELEDYSGAEGALKKALFLDSDFVMAHYTLGTVNVKMGNNTNAEKYYTTALGLLLSLLRKTDTDTVVPGSEGMPASSLIRAVQSAITALHGRVAV